MREIVQIENSSSTQRQQLSLDEKVDEWHIDNFLIQRKISQLLNSRLTCICVFLFVTMSMTAGIIIVNFTTARNQGQVCKPTYKPLVNQKIQYNPYTRSTAIGDFNRDNHLDMVLANYGSDNIGIRFGKGDGTFGNQITYSTGASSRPYFVIVNDFNNDTLLDIAVANYGTNCLGIFFSNGNGSFQNQITFSTGNSRPIYIAVGDFNQDKIPDVVIASYGSDSISVMLGVNDKIFTSSIIYSTGYDSDPRSIAVADLNNDNIQDIVVANFGTNNIGIFYGYENGSFETQKLLSTGYGSQPYSITVSDINKDNHLDIIVANTGLNNVGIFLGYGNGTFASQMTLFTGNGSNPHYVLVTYFNNDQFEDILVANSGNDTVGIWTGIGNGSFNSMRTFSTGYGSHPQCISIGDFNHDNRTDIIVANNNSDSVGILLNQPSINLQAQINYWLSSGSAPAAVIVGDFNNDNHLDIVVANNWANNVVVFLGFGNGTLASPIFQSTTPSSSPYALASGDFNNDTYLDIVVANQESNSIGVLLGYGNGSLEYPVIYSTGSGSSPKSVAVSDLNNDKCLDIVVANSNGNNVGVFLGFCNGSFGSQTTFSTGDSSTPYSIAIGNFNNDKYLDIVVANYNGQTVGIFFGDGTGTFATQITYSVGELSYPSFVYAANLNNDSLLDIIVTKQSRDRIGFFIAVGNGSFASLDNYYTGLQSLPDVICAGDLNNDKSLDVIIGDSNTNYLSIFSNLGNGTFTSLIQQPVQVTPSRTFVAVGDLNDDNQLDVIFSNFYGNFIGILFGYDAGTLSSVNEYSTSNATLPSSLTIADFNQDKRLDVGVSNSDSNNFDIFFGNANSTFTTKYTISTNVNSHPWMINSGNLNNDNIPDIVIANTGNDNIGIFFGYGNGSFRDMETLSTGTKSQPYAIAIGDFNHDNRSDFAVANFGSNSMGIFLAYDIGVMTITNPLTIYSSSTQQNIAYLAVGDFNHDNLADIVFVASLDNTIGIFLASNNGTFIGPTIYSVGPDSKPTFIAVADFNNDTNLDLVVANRNADNIGILLGNGNGTFADMVTYSTDSTPVSVAFGDFNNDTYLDIVVANQDDDDINILINNSDGTFTDGDTYYGDSDSAPASVVVDDVNNDGYLDIIVANNGTNTIGIFLGSGDGEFADEVTYSTFPGTSPYFLATGDFNNDKQQDIVVLNQGNGIVLVYLGSGNETFTDPVVLSTGSLSQPVSLTVADLNSDGSLDIAVACSYVNVITVFIGYGNGGFSTDLTYGLSQFYNPQQIAAADFNGDHRLDCVVFDYFRIYVFLGSPLESYLPITTYDTGIQSSPRSISVGDLNNDNLPDVIVANSGSGNIGVFFGVDFGIFTNQTTFSLGNNSKPYSVALGNFDNDTNLDIAVANYASGSVDIFLGDGKGNFTSPMTYSTGYISDPYSLALGDFNNDTQLDIVVASFSSNYISILYGVGNGTFINNTIIPVGYHAYPSFVAVGDMNNDYLLDVAYSSYGYGTIDVLSEMC
ncbi:unnamed protein product [Adineta steineri]|uniref:Uncharacterized protein n=1 Tax=Adineta steineri TaxID=433720 RepID=A0A815BTG4_9BILA|nr:unnamed protein product [Adineta steineri]CAF1274668.1 unnamed protein product [Adineta steineri]CAF1559391.1 unnamed protein product [Adineta steineri]